MKARKLAEQIAKDLIEIDYTNAATPDPNSLCRMTYLLNAVQANVGELPQLVRWLKTQAANAVDNLDYIDYTERKDAENE